MSVRNLKACIEELDLPCYVYDVVELETNILAFEHAFSTAWGGETIVGFSVKTAPIAGLIQQANKLGCYIEVVSDDEFELALKAKTDPQRIIFNGPIKNKKWLYYAFEHNAIVNLDSKRELDWTIEFVKESSTAPRVGLRIGFDLDEIIPGESVADDGMTRFGFDWNNGSFFDAVTLLRDAGIEPVGIHAHFSTKNHLAQSFELFAKKVCEVARTCDLSQLEYVDMGGGYYGGGSHKDYYSEYATRITNELKRGFNPNKVTLILEPGGSILATAGKYMGRVIDVKVKKGIKLLTCELSSLNTNPTVFGRLRSDCEVISGNSSEYSKRQHVELQELCGYTCMEMDRLALLKDYPEIRVGDIVILDNTGAYSASFMPMFFIKKSPRLYAYKEGLYSELSLCGDDLVEVAK